jgi:hypothetical protein
MKKSGQPFSHRAAGGVGHKRSDAGDVMLYSDRDTISFSSAFSELRTEYS